MSVSTTMRISIFLISILILISVSVQAEDTFNIPSSSSLKLIEVGPSRGDLATFNGEAILSGKYVIGWKIIDEEPYQLEARLFLNEESQAQLPHEDSKPQVKELSLAHSDQVAGLLLSEVQSEKLLAKEIITISGEATIRINNFASGIDCDQRWYMANLIEVITPTVVANVSETEYQFGC